MPNYNKRPDKGERRRQKQQERAALETRALITAFEHRQNREQAAFTLMATAINMTASRLPRKS